MAEALSRDGLHWTILMTGGSKVKRNIDKILQRKSTLNKHVYFYQFALMAIAC